jgi:hypothetical protein
MKGILYFLGSETFSNCTILAILVLSNDERAILQPAISRLIYASVDLPC